MTLLLWLEICLNLLVFFFFRWNLITKPVILTHMASHTVFLCDPFRVPHVLLDSSLLWLVSHISHFIVLIVISIDWDDPKVLAHLKNNGMKWITYIEKIYLSLYIWESWKRDTVPSKSIGMAWLVLFYLFFFCYTLVLRHLCLRSKGEFETTEFQFSFSVIYV